MLKYGYIRVSSLEQNLDRQKEKMMQLGIKSNNVYEEKRSGKNLERPVLLKLLDKLKEGDELYVVSIDRLGRRIKDIVDVVESLSERGITIVSVNENINTSTDFGRVFVCLASIFAEVERKNIRERQRAGIEIAKREGRMKGRPRKKLLDDFELAYEQFKCGTITADKAGRILGLSRASFYRRINEYEISKGK